MQLSAPSHPERRLDGTPVLRCENLGIRYRSGQREVPVLEAVDLEIEQGEFVCIVGPSGTGKTTLLKALGGLVDVESESVLEHEGRPISGPPERVAFVFQNYSSALLPWRTVAKNVSLGIEHDTPRGQRAAKIAQALGTVRLDDRADEYPWRLSGGMQQRVQIARALAMDPDTFLMDEPFGALDAMTKGQLQDELHALHRRTGATFVFVTHDIDEAVYLGNRIIVLSGSPSRVSDEIHVNLPEERDLVSTKELPEYLELRRRVFESVHGNHGDDD